VPQGFAKDIEMVFLFFVNQHQLHTEMALADFDGR
jgi:hypothetical protein